MKKLKSKLESTNTDSFGVSGSDFTRTQKSHRQFLVTSTMKMQTESTDQLKLDLPPVVNLPFQNKIRSQKRSRNQIRTSDLFNVYKAPQTLATNPESLLKKKRQYQISQSIIKYYSDEITALKDQQSLDDQEIENCISKYLNEAIQSLDVLIKKIQNLLQYKQNREKSEQEMKEIMQECFKQKNLCIQQRFCYIFGKMEQLFFNPLSGAIYFKLCKRLSDNEIFYRNKMKAYRGLGECLLRVRPKLSQLYFTKYLMSAWKLNEKNHELYAYDLLGKYYFYVGQIEKAKLFHEKMIGGYCEVPESRVRILAQSRLEQGSLSNRINREHQVVDIDVVTSDDECYEIVLTQPQQIKVATVSSVKYFQRKIPDPKSVKEEANTNIRQKKPKYNSQLLEIGGEFDMSKLVISNPHLNIGAIKDRVLLSHMSPNRKLEMYQYLCLASDKNAFNNVNLLSGLYDRFEISKINKYLTKLISLLSTVQQWLMSQQKHKQVTRRFALV
ncbi:unnamed protein product (macronuclear) [Paramecium tetraurelia]|uniref:DNA/RNA-binding domain-containing protein n=1 Tax=Paramecium tetraurelia TaxID=5888 RepID=A0E3R5_PARTE|nr:uncharacterized protein GSPATT00023105001 [Paramecium tetraurelia]CAK89932.1 unnamed protein product [Paramecium tetraurelia]|eukprot:XP_001457329.1 hypothetical protein (macronuclear) [Paramecium tetraurelia strain d4-2]